MQIFINRVALSRRRIYDAIAMVSIGLGSSLAVLAFKALIDLIHEGLFVKLYGFFSGWGGWTILFLPIIGGAAVGWLRQTLIPAERHHGVAGVMESVALAGGRLPYQRVPLKALASAISIGAGASVGPEDPSVQLGAGLGSFLGQKLKMSPGRTRLLVAMGAGSGIAAAFNAPIAGVFFATELILGELKTSSFGMIVFSSVISAVTTRAVIGQNPAFPIPAYKFNSPIELIFYLILGLLAAIVSVAYIKSIYWAHDWFHNSKIPLWIRPMLVGALLGAVGIFRPEIFGDSYTAIGDILFGRSTIISVLLLLLALKIILTALSLGSGFMGGVFAPSLFLGATLGGAFGLAASKLFPSLIIQPSAFALVGMAAVLAGTVRAPATAIMLLFEMTNDYHILLPLMFAVVVSMYLSRSIHETSVYELSLLRKGIRLQRGRAIDVLEMLRVSEVMRDIPQQVKSGMPLKMVSHLLAETRHHGLPVIGDNGALCGIISLTDIDQAVEKSEKNFELPVSDFCSHKIITAYPDETVRDAMLRMSGHDIGRMPVVSREDETQLIGWLSRANIIHAYELALSRYSAGRHRIEQVQLDALSGAEILELIVTPDSAVDGAFLKDVKWVNDSLVASVQRGRRLMIPHGSTRLQAGDRLALVAEPEDEKALRDLVTKEKKSEEPPQ